MTTKQHYYGVASSHPVLKMLQGIGPFPTAAEAGAALDQLQACYPAASLRIFDISAQFIAAAQGDSIEDKIEHARYCLEMTLGKVEPYRVVEALGGHVPPITTAYALDLAARTGCPVEEIGVIEGQPLWGIVRVHLETPDYAKAETKALWLRRSREAEQGGDNQGDICVVTLPIYAPIEHRIEHPQ